jgi:RecJ-like exonuclease
MLQTIENIIEDFKKASENAIITIISHYDTDGITAAAILAKALQREDKKFSIKIIKQLEKKFIDELKERVEEKERKELIVFLDLGSSSLDALCTIPVNIFVFDHHEVNEELKNLELKQVRFINSHLLNEEVSAAGLVYLFVKLLNPLNRDLAHLAVIGMVGDMLEQSISKINNHILKDAADVTVKRGLLIFSAARPLNKALEFSSDIFIPGVTGSATGSLEFLREAGIRVENGKYPGMLELSQEEMSKLITNIVLRRLHLGSGKEHDIIGNIYLVKFFNKIEDARELSTLINACSRLGYSDIALGFCLGSSEARVKADDIYNRYKHEIIHALKWIENNKTIEGGSYVIINAKDNIKDSIIGTAISIIASSYMYEDGTILVGLAYRDNKIKVSARLCGRKNKQVNLQRLLDAVIKMVGGECGGHAQAAGCLVPKEKEEAFINVLKKEIESEGLKIKV